MTTRRRTPALPADPVSIALVSAAAGALVLGLTGCAAIQRTLQHEHEEQFASYAEAKKGWVGVGMPEWIPRDATDVRNLATENEQAAVIRVVSDAELAPGCEPAARTGLPALTAGWTEGLLHQDPLPDSVLACGEYEVIEVPDGWFGWFNAAEPGDTPDR